MKFEIEINDKDIEDRKILQQTIANVKNFSKNMSAYGNNTMARSLYELRDSLENCDREWLLNQRKAVENKLSEVLNIELKKWIEVNEWETDWD